jgi:hypothetical protein
MGVARCPDWAKINASVNIIFTFGSLALPPDERELVPTVIDVSFCKKSPFASADLRHSVEVRSAGMQFAGTYRPAMAEKPSKCRLQIGKL